MHILSSPTAAVLAAQLGVDDSGELVGVALHHAHQGLERRLLALESNLRAAVGAAVLWCWGVERPG